VTDANENDDLVRRVLDTVPARSYALGALLSLLRVEASEDVPTACVSCERRPVLRVNPRFVKEHCRTDAHLFMLVMHELHHVLLGHTRLFPRPTPAQNVAFDAVINALLCARFPEQAYTSFFTEQYSQEEGPLRILAPPRHREEPDQLDTLHRTLFAGEATAEEVFHAITREVGFEEVSIDGLLGSHEREQHDGTWGTESADPMVVDAIRRIVETWPPPADPIRGRSLASVLKPMTVTPETAIAAAVRKATRDALLGAADRGCRQSRKTAGAVRALVPLPDPADRRAGVARGLGATPLLCWSAVEDRRGRDEGAAHVYLDVSGSMDPWMALLYGALASLRRHIAPGVHLFSTQVETVPLRALRDGVRTTTGGTDLQCVLDHALAARARRILIVTDGYVGQTPQDEARKAEKAGLEVRVLLTPGGWQKDLEPLATRIQQLPDARASRNSRRNP
jgi:hypothetical protein